ncbi:hypothetical protein Tco_1401846 [Tanacetum coccineum]
MALVMETRHGVAFKRYGVLLMRERNLTAPTITFPGIEEYDVFSIIYEPIHGIIYTNRKKEKRVMRPSKIHKFCDATLRRTVEGLKSYYNDVKYGYVQKELTNDEGPWYVSWKKTEEYMKTLSLFEEVNSRPVQMFQTPIIPELLGTQMKLVCVTNGESSFSTGCHIGSLCYPTNDRDDLGKKKPKADIGVFIGYSETSTGFQIYNRWTKMIMETIHAKFDELTAIAFEHDYLEPELQRFNNHNSSAEPMNSPSKEDLDNLFGPMFKEYFEKTSSDITINSATQPTQVHEDSSSTSSIFVDAHEAPPIVNTSDEQTSPISLTEADEFNQEDYADFDGNAQFVPYNPPSREEIESSTTAIEPSNVQNFHQVQPSTHI